MIILNHFYGRLGNNIIQISNIIHIAIACKHNIKFNVKHKFFDFSVIEKYFNKYNNNEIITNTNFYSINKLPFSNDIFKQNVEERNKLLKEAFLINNINKLNENDLVIHVRSGDIFSSPRPHPEYVPPPLSYYTKEIDKYKYEKIHIICEDTKNPVVNELLKLYKNAIYEKNTLEKDITIILGATNIIFSIGTFIPSLILLSNNIKYLHGNRLSNNEELIEYYKVMKPWKNTIEQRKYILTYDYN
jgi:hypothetical protein